MGKYFLIGIPNCGKSTLGRLTAAIMKLPFFDTDDMARKKLKLESALDFLRSALNSQFINAQRASINELAELDGDAIIATGAEVALIQECARRMHAVGTIIHIKRNPENALENPKNNGKRRLVFCDVTEGTEIDTHKMAVELYMKEYSQYEVIADLSMDNNGSEDEGMQKLVMLINMCQKQHTIQTK